MELIQHEEYFIQNKELLILIKELLIQIYKGFIQVQVNNINKDIILMLIIQQIIRIKCSKDNHIIQHKII